MRSAIFRNHLRSSMVHDQCQYIFDVPRLKRASIPYVTQAKPSYTTPGWLVREPQLWLVDERHGIVHCCFPTNDQETVAHFYHLYI